MSGENYKDLPLKEVLRHESSPYGKIRISDAHCP
jgi:hypothetical protein